MKKHLFTDHFLLNLPAVQIFKSFLRSALLGPAFFLLMSPNVQSAINIAVLDTGFCPDLIAEKKVNVKIASVRDFTQSVNLECEASKFNRSDRRFHGHLLIEEFVKYYQRGDQELNLFPGVVFDQLAQQRPIYWRRAIDWIASNNIDFVLTASGLITSSDLRLPKKLPGIWFVPAGRAISGINNSTKLYPQMLAPKDNLFVIGDYFEGSSIIYDEALLYKKQIDYYFASGVGSFNGTSRAVGEALARALTICSKNNMRQCLKDKSKKLTLFKSHKTILTF